MIGFLVKNAVQGLGRIEIASPQGFKIRFFATNQVMTFAASRTPSGVEPVGIVRILLGLNLPFNSDQGACRIKKYKLGKGWSEFHRYEVEFENGRLAELVETEITPIPLPDKNGSSRATPLDAMLQLQHEGYSTFTCREAFLESYIQALRGGLGLRALLSSRIDLRSHQAYVAGVVLLDPRQRYILADEVGLGKTIEAGIIIHDLLSRKSTARVLILAPGALVQQWLCELYAKFCGRIFRLPEFGSDSAFLEGNAPQIILSFHGAKQRQTQLLNTAWDLIVIDETHQIIADPGLYDLAQQLSRNAGGLLLLSALPAQHRELEYLKLLALLEPEHYNLASLEAAKRFRDLYARQRQLGIVIRWVSRKLPEVVEKERDPEELIEKLIELTEWPELENDTKLKALVNILDGQSPQFADDISTVLHHIADTHRINRRILRNRRSRLIAQEQMAPITRTLNRINYAPGIYELDSIEYVRRLLQQLRDGGLDKEILPSLAQSLFQACADPECLVRTLDFALESVSLPSTDYEIGSLDSCSSYPYWPTYSVKLWHHAKSILNVDVLDAARHAAKSWKREGEERARFHALVAFLKKKHRTQPNEKYLIFAGFPGLAKSLYSALIEEFTARDLTRFYFGMADTEKEEQVRFFRRDPLRWLLVCDESGGEGRNFQFADEIIHFDTPWNAARVEQRIGRLDRLGRERLDVVSNVIYAEGSEEDGLVSVFAEGLGIYAESISGLEFALREVERDLANAALVDGRDAMLSLTSAIQQTAKNERTEDESAELFDEASNERRVASGFRRVQSSAVREKALENTFINYFKHIAPGRSIDLIRDGNFSEGIVQFHPDDIRGFTFALAKDGAGRIADRIGTFYREIAQERPDLEFFSVGNPLFDAVSGSLFSEVSGRTYAIETRLSEVKWRGFEFVFRVVPSSISEERDFITINQVNRIFSYRIERVWIRDDGSRAQFPAQLLAIRQTCQKANKDRGWSNLTKEKSVAVQRFYMERGWNQVVIECYDLALKSAREQFNEVLGEILKAEFSRIDEQKRQLSSLRPNGWKEDADAIDQVRTALSEWTVELDSVGFMSVNGGLLH